MAPQILCYDCISDITDMYSSISISSANSNNSIFKDKINLQNRLLDINELDVRIKCKFVCEEFYKEFLAMFKYCEKLSQLQKEIAKLVLIEYIELNKVEVDVNKYDNELYAEDPIDIKYNVILFLVDNNITTINRFATQNQKRTKNGGLTFDIFKSPYIGIRIK